MKSPKLTVSEYAALSVLVQAKPGVEVNLKELKLSTYAKGLADILLSKAPSDNKVIIDLRTWAAGLRNSR